MSSIVLFEDSWRLHNPPAGHSELRSKRKSHDIRHSRGQLACPFS